MGAFSIGHWLVLAIIVILIFGTGKLKSAGKDLGEANSEFKKGVSEKDNQEQKHTDTK